jgi:hypothetical protein
MKAFEFADIKMDAATFLTRAGVPQAWQLTLK